MRRTLTTIIIGLSLVLGSAATAEATPGPGNQCTEDMACWNCETMGNRICGSDRAVKLNGRNLTPRAAAHRFYFAPGRQCITAIRRADGSVDRLFLCHP